MRVLLVEDDDVLRDVLCRSLTAAGHRVDVAGDGQSAQPFPYTHLTLPTNREGLISGGPGY